jgi:hypothetical protein
MLLLMYLCSSMNILTKTNCKIIFLNYSLVQLMVRQHNFFNFRENVPLSNGMKKYSLRNIECLYKWVRIFSVIVNKLL